MGERQREELQSAPSVQTRREVVGDSVAGTIAWEDVEAVEGDEHPLTYKVATFSDKVSGLLKPVLVPLLVGLVLIIVGLVVGMLKNK